MTRHKTAGWATRPRVALLAVLAFASLGMGLYAYATALAAPTITASPANPTNQTSATFGYKHTASVTFECSLDASTFVPCGVGKTGSKTYTGLSPGSHTFQVRALSGAQTSAAATYNWTIDTTVPYVLSINRLGTDPTNASSVQWSVTFSESVTGVDSSDFALVKGGGLGGTPVVTSVSGSGAIYTVTASSGSGQGTLGLNLVDNDSIKDPAGNKLGGTGTGNGNYTGAVYHVDKIPPPAPVITSHPPDPSPTNTVTFAWTGEAGATFQCSIDDGPWTACTSPYTFTVTSKPHGSEGHVFKVRARDAAGNLSDETAFSFKVSNDRFTISGDVSGLYPGVWRSIPIALTNPNGYSIQVTQLTVSLGSSPPGCQSPWIAFRQSPISSTHTITVPANSTVNLAAADQPQIQLIEAGVNQDACKNQHFGLLYGGMAIH
jgi:hypothetical protein